MSDQIVLKLNNRPGNPRNSEGSFVTLRDGRILFIYTRYRGKSWADHASAVLAARESADGGRTWSRKDRVVVDHEGACNVMSVSLLRLHNGRIALFYLRKNSGQDCRPWMRTSRDEGVTWSRPTCCIPAPGYFVVNNDRVVQLRSGRLVVPAAFHRSIRVSKPGDGGGLDGRSIFMMFLSDDGGATWRESKDWWALPVRSRSGFQEPGVVELKGKTLYGWARTDTGRQWDSVSRDQGDTWAPLKPSPFRAPCAPLCMKRIPSTGDLLAVWNDHDVRWKRLPQFRRRWGTDRSWGRTPLVVGISRNEGKTWPIRRLIESNPDHGYCYTAIHFADDAVLLAYCCGGGSRSHVLQDVCIRRLPLAALYGC
ncbi:MAG: hypothetical protein A2498_14010 [Lentisphaerae bacterium RIFOXYC12_FULL_60_16]|nr:MAG: hypothetical protein A2498_14010 [Lentisphaerae bacterium RIFOXYC12_FULL_60_16]